jgi:hypothetical protein
VLAFGGGMDSQLLEGRVQNNTACMVLSVLADSRLTVNRTTLMGNDVAAGTIFGECTY